ncbi:MAG: DUF3486 family protein [Burkholderiales bacterium]|nr:DUF3486 family protein [Burkholderiales bacterium]
MPGTRSSIKRLDPRIREAVDAAIREDRATLDEIVQLIEQLGRELGTGDTASRSAVHRYRQTMEEGMEVFRATQGMAHVWAQKLEEDPASDVARLAAQVLGAVALNTSNALVRTGEAVPAGEVMFLAKALDHLSRAEKVNAERELKVRAQVLEQAAKRVSKIAQDGGMSAELRAEILNGILGVQS